MLDLLGSLPRRLRWALHRWSASADREFHDALFSAQTYNPFSFAYPGYITIRRFAELTESHLAGVRRAYDLGCGPGEITCELARRNPHIAFVGVDHSAAAIARAREHQTSLNLTNAEFHTADVSAFTPDAADIVLMYDSFHHLLDPRGFVSRLTPDVPAFVLIEPAGDWLGGWQQTLDLDWIPSALDAIRERLVWQLNIEGSSVSAGEEAADIGDPVEHRYTLSDLQGFFEGYGLDIRGTIAGLGEYPPHPHTALPLREEFGAIAAAALASVEDVLFRHNLDLHAKHWVIHAARGAEHRLRIPAPLQPRTDIPRQTKGPYDVLYGPYDGPTEVRAGTMVPVTLTLTNDGWRPWRSDDERAPVLVSYHWLDANGAVAIEDGRRTPLPRPLLPGESLTMTASIETPRSSGRYVLAFDLVEEGVTWFSHAGARMLKVPMNVR